MINVLSEHSIHITNFVRRQTMHTRHSHWTLSDEELLASIKAMARIPENQIPGYKDGVTIVKVPPYGFFSSIRALKNGDPLYGSFSKRKDNEEPRKNCFAKGVKQPAKSAFVVLYHRDVLSDKKENESDCDWEIVAVLASPTNDPTPSPMDPDTLIANHFELSGGTKSGMNSEEFVLALKESVLYWKDKALVEPIYE